jgi:hypothetical protein
MLRLLAFLLICASGVRAVGAQAAWKLVEDLRVGGDDGPYLFSDIRGVVAGPSGNIFVLDFTAQEIRMFDAKGVFVKTVARRGQGPGELRNANGMLLAKDGLIWVSDPNQRRWSAFSAANGNFVRQIRLPILSYGYVWEVGLDRRGRIVDRITVEAPGRRGPDGEPVREARLRLVDVSERPQRSADSTAIGPPADTVAIPTCNQRVAPREYSFIGRDTSGRAMGYMSVPYLPRSLFVFGLDGTLWCTGGDEYVVLHRAIGGGDTLHSVRANFPPVAVSARERSEAIESANRFLARYARKDLDVSLVPQTKPAITDLDLDREGRVWVRRSAPEGSAPLTWEVYDAAGRRVATASSPHVLLSAATPFITNDEAYFIVRDEDGVPGIVRFRITR